MVVVYFRVWRVKLMEEREGLERASVWSDGRVLEMDV